MPGWRTERCCRRFKVDSESDQGAPHAVVRKSELPVNVDTPEDSPGQVAEGLTQRFATGMAWTLGGIAVAEPIRIAVTAALARLLTPDEFGVVAMAAVFLGVGTILNDMGLSVALIQRKALSAKAEDSVFWLSIGVGIVVVGAMVAISGPVAVLYGEPEVRLLLVALSTSLLVNSFVLVQHAAVRRRLQFAPPALANIAGVVVSGVAAVCAAVAGFGVWSLIVLNIAYALASGVYIHVAAHYRPRPRFAWREAVPLIRYGATAMGADAAAYGSSTIDNFIVGSLSGPGLLGVYGVAFNLVVYPVRRIAAMAAMVTLPAFSRVQGDRVRTVRGYLRTVQLSSHVVFPVLAVAVALASELVTVFYGLQWTDAVAPMQILCVAAAVRCVVVVDETVLRALGRPQLQLVWAGFMMAGVALGAVLGASGGLVRIAAGVAIATSVVGVVGHWLLNRLLCIENRVALGAVWPALASALCSGLLAHGCRVVGVQAGLPALATMAAAALVGLALPWLILRRLSAFSALRDLEVLATGVLIPLIASVRGWLSRASSDSN